MENKHELESTDKENFLNKTLATSTVNAKDDLDLFFEEFIDSKPIFKDKSVLQSSYFPTKLYHRESYLKEIAKILAPALRLEKPSNLFIYGKTGTGKTISIKHVLEKITNIALSKDIPLKIIIINCKLKKVADTEYRILLEILKQFGKEYPSTGLSTNELYKALYETMNDEKRVTILVLDEIDALIQKAGDEVLYNLTRINSEVKNSEVSLIGITNDLIIMDNLDARVKSSLSEEEIVFLPYNALQLQDILKDRSILAFKENALNEEVIPRVAALAAREHGDARRALELLRFSGEIAEREKSDKVYSEHVDKANKKLEKNRIIDVIKSQPKQFQLVTYAIIKTSIKEKHNLITNKKMQVIEPTTTGEVFDYYIKLTKKLNIPSLTMRRVSDIITELDILGLISSKLVSKGRFGRTRWISFGVPKSMFPEVISILEKELALN